MINKYNIVLAYDAGKVSAYFWMFKYLQKISQNNGWESLVLFQFCWFYHERVIDYGKYEILFI